MTSKKKPKGPARPARDQRAKAHPSSASPGPSKRPTRAQAAADSAADLPDATLPTPAKPEAPQAPTASVRPLPFSAKTLHDALAFTLAACPREGTDARVVFDVDSSGRVLLAAHDRTRCHVAYLPLHADCAARGAVVRPEAVKLLRLLRSLGDDDEASVTVSFSGRVTIQRLSQPELVHRLDPTLSTTDWRPQRDLGTPTALPLHMASDTLQKAVRWREAVVEIEQRSSARIIVSIRQGGEVVGRAYLAEAGVALYDPEQPPLPFGITTIVPPRALASNGVSQQVAAATEELKQRLRAVDSPASSRANDDGPTRGAVVEVPEAIWDALTPEQIERLHQPTRSSMRVPWFTEAECARSRTLSGTELGAVIAVGGELGLDVVLADLHARRHGLEVELWTMTQGGAV